MGHRSNSPTLETTGRLSGSRTARTSTLFSVSLLVGMACYLLQQQDCSCDAADHVQNIRYSWQRAGAECRWPLLILCIDCGCISQFSAAQIRGASCGGNGGRHEKGSAGYGGACCAPGPGTNPHAAQSGLLYCCRWSPALGVH